MLTELLYDVCPASINTIVTFWIKNSEFMLQIRLIRYFCFVVLVWPAVKISLSIDDFESKKLFIP